MTNEWQGEERRCGKERRRTSMMSWWDAHPLFKQFYVPMVLTATFLVTIIGTFNGSGGCGR